MSATKEDIDKMTLVEAVHYLRIKIHTHKQGIQYCEKILKEYGDPK